jgi:hypothetical protein
VTNTCNVAATAQKLKKVIQENLNAIRLHDSNVKERTSRRWQLLDDMNDRKASKPEFTDMSEGEDAPEED